MPMKKFLKGLYATFNGGKYILFTIGLFLVLLPVLNILFPALGGLDRPTEIGVYTAAGIFFLLFFTVYFYLPLKTKVIFTIRKGSHFSFPRKIKFMTKHYVSAKLELTHNMLYEDTGHTNKLIGFSNGFHHLWRSARIGWRPHQDGVRVQFYAYIRDNGALHIYPLGAFKPGKAVDLSIALLNYSADEHPSYLFSTGNFTKTVPARGIAKIRYYLWPYFGGKQKAPHTMTLEMSFYE